MSGVELTDIEKKAIFNSLSPLSETDLKKVRAETSKQIRKIDHKKFLAQHFDGNAVKPTKNEETIRMTASMANFLIYGDMVGIRRCFDDPDSVGIKSPSKTEHRFPSNAALA